MVKEGTADNRQFRLDPPYKPLPNMTDYCVSKDGRGMLIACFAASWLHGIRVKPSPRPPRTPHWLAPRARARGGPEGLAVPAPGPTAHGKSRRTRLSFTATSLIAGKDARVERRHQHGLREGRRALTTLQRALTATHRTRNISSAQRASSVSCTRNGPRFALDQRLLIAVKKNSRAYLGTSLSTSSCRP